MHVLPEIHHSPDVLGQSAAAIIADGIAAAGRDGRQYLLGCPTGRSPQPVFRALTDEVRTRRLDLSHVVLVLMDDYVTRAPGGAFQRVPAHLPYSCEGFGRRHIAGPLAQAAAQAGRSSQPALWLPDPADPAAYDQRIAAYGGLDLFILACGTSDGHIAFNPPGSARDSITRIIELPEATRRDNLVTFPEFPNLDAVPTHGVSVGIGTIAELSKSAVMVVHGPDKARAYQRLSTATDYEPDWPATILTACRQPRLLADRAAMSGESTLTPRH
ncbi:6-phosphogluconolactonase [Dactylosporangium sp. CA-233914]|uniref:6-phosphogluconolactonase n=1 Tax=Dactylosporangium sp. CA-233914 TaxID=3239934 RepID=UPI003D924268